MRKNPFKVLFLAALSLGFVLFSFNAAAANVSSSLRYVPKDAFLVAGIDGDKVRTSALYKTLVDMAMKEKDVNKGLAEFKAATGFDPTKDVRSLVVALGSSFPKDNDNFILIAEARISEAKVIAFMKKKNAKIQTVKTRQGTHYLLGRRKDGFLAFRGGHVLLGGKNMRAAVMAKQGPSAALSRQLAPVKRNHIFFAMEPTAEIKKEMAREQKDLGQLKAMSAGLDVVRGAKLNVNARFNNAAAASNVHKMLDQGMKEVAKSRQGKRMKADQLLRSVKLQKMGPSLRGSVSLSQKQVDDLTKLLIQLM